MVRLILSESSKVGLHGFLVLKIMRYIYRLLMILTVLLFLFYIFIGFFASKGVLQDGEMELSNGFIFYKLSKTGARIEYEGASKEKYTASSNTVDAFFDTKKYLLIVRRPYNRAKKKFDLSCRFIIINMKTHKTFEFVNSQEFIEKINELEPNKDEFRGYFTFNKEDPLSCRYNNWGAGENQRNRLDLLLKVKKNNHIVSLIKSVLN